MEYWLVFASLSIIQGQDLLPAYRNSWVDRHHLLPLAWPPTIDGLPLCPLWGCFCHLPWPDCLPSWSPSEMPGKVRERASPLLGAGRDGCWGAPFLHTHLQAQALTTPCATIATSSLSPTAGTNIFSRVLSSSSITYCQRCLGLPGEPLSLCPRLSPNLYLHPQFFPYVSTFWGPDAFCFWKVLLLSNMILLGLFFGLYWKVTINY